MCLTSWQIWSGTVRSCGIVRVPVDLLEEVCHHGGQDLRSQMFKLDLVWQSPSEVFRP